MGTGSDVLPGDEAAASGNAPEGDTAPVDAVGGLRCDPRDDRTAQRGRSARRSGCWANTPRARRAPPLKRCGDPRADERRGKWASFSNSPLTAAGVARFGPDCRLPGLPLAAAVGRPQAQ